MLKNVMEFDVSSNQMRTQKANGKVKRTVTNQRGCRGIVSTIQGSVPVQTLNS